MAYRFFSARRRRAQRGQAAVETALIAPLFILLAVGTWDVSDSAAKLGVVRNAVRSAVLVGQQGGGSDIGDAARNELSGNFANTPAIWGKTGAGQANSDCSGVTTQCGDPGGCVTASAHWNTPAVPGGAKPVACYAVTPCTLSGSTCTPVLTGGRWQGRATVGSGDALLVRVTVRKKPLTPVVGVALTSGYVVITSDGYIQPSGD